jgi:hypothetical protein
MRPDMKADGGEGAGLGSFLLRALAWAGVSASLLAGGFYAVGAVLVAIGSHRAEASLGEVQIAGLHALFFAVLREALLPHWLLTLATWLVLARLLPRLEGAWRFLGPSLFAVAALWFPAVGFGLFSAWKPASTLDVANTWLLMTAAIGVSLLLPRVVLRSLAPGALARPMRRSTLTRA